MNGERKMGLIRGNINSELIERFLPSGSDSLNKFGRSRNGKVNVHKFPVNRSREMSQ